MSTIAKGEFFAIASGLLYSLLGYFGMSALSADLSVSNMLFWRFFISTVLMCLIFLFKKRTARPQFSETLRVLLYAGTLYSIGPILYFMACRYLGTGLAMVIFFTYPAIVLLINSLFYKAPIEKTHYLALLLILIGIGLLVNIDDMSFNTTDMAIGIGLGVLSAFSYALYILSNKKNKIAPLPSTFILSLGCTLVCFTVAVADQSLVMPSNPTVWLYLLGIGVICTTLPILLFLESLKYISPEKASMLSVLEPVFVVIFGITLLGENIHLVQVLGIITILAGALITLLNKKSK